MAVNRPTCAANLFVVLARGLSHSMASTCGLPSRGQITRLFLTSRKTRFSKSRTSSAGVIFQLWICTGCSCPQLIHTFFFFQAEDGIRDLIVTGVQTCALPISSQLCGLNTLTRAGKLLSES